MAEEIGGNRRILAPNGSRTLTMGDFEDISLIDPELNTSYTVRLSAAVAEKARTDMNFASALLRYAQNIEKAQKPMQMTMGNIHHQTGTVRRETPTNEATKRSAVPVQTKRDSNLSTVKKTVGSTAMTQMQQTTPMQFRVDSRAGPSQTNLVEYGTGEARNAQSIRSLEPEPLDPDNSNIANDPAIDTDGTYNWSKAESLQLIDLYEENRAMFESGKNSQKFCWNHISELFKTKGYIISGRKCSTKFQALKRTYKNIKDHNGKSGNGRKDWEYFLVMEDLFKEKPWVAPTATAGSDAVDFDDPSQQPKRVRSTPVNEYLKELMKHEQDQAAKRDVQHTQKIEALSQLRDVMLQYLNKN